MEHGKKSSLVVVLAFALLAANSPLLASSLATSSRQYLKIPFGVRPASLGGSFAGLADDHNAVHYNPAGLVQVIDPVLDLMYLSYFADVNFFYGGGALPLGRFGNYACSLIYSWVEPFNSTADQAAEKGTFSDMSATLGVGYDLGFVALGGGLRLIRSSLMGSSSMGMGVDLGAMLFLADGRMSLGLSGTNALSFSGSYGEYSFKEKLPTELRCGLAYRFRRRAANRVTITMEVDRPLDSYLWFHAGSEVVLMDVLALRAGYKLHEHGLDLGDLSGFSGGSS